MVVVVGCGLAVVDLQVGEAAVVVASVPVLSVLVASVLVPSVLVLAFALAAFVVAGVGAVVEVCIREVLLKWFRIFLERLDHAHV